MSGCRQDTLRGAKPKWQRFYELDLQSFRRILGLDFQDTAEIDSHNETILARGQRSQRAAGSSTPDRLLLGQFSAELESFLQAPNRHQIRQRERPDVRHEFSSFEFSFKKILPFAWDLVCVDQRIVIGGDSDLRALRHDVAVMEIHYGWRNI